MRWLVFLIHFGALAGYTHGQSVTDTILIREVRVTGLRKAEHTGLSISRPDSMALISAISSYLSELIAHNTPVFIKTYGRGSVATASFRGTSASHTQLVWNGMALNSPMRGSADLSLLPVMFVDDVWLLHGGSSLTENSGALGGSIHLGNKADWTITNGISAVAERGSYNSGTYLLRFQTGKNNFRSVTRLMFDHSDNNFPYYNLGVLPHRNDTLHNANYLKLALLQELYHRFGFDSQAVLRFWVQASDRLLPQLMSYEGSERRETQTDEQGRLQLEVRNYSSHIKYHYSSGLNYMGLRYQRYVFTPWFVIDDAFSYESSIYNRLKINTEINYGLHLSVSVEANYHSIKVQNEPREIEYGQNRFEVGSMAHLQYPISDKWGLFALVRSEYYDNRFIPFIPSLGAEVSISGVYPLLLKVNGARNYHKPSLNDLYWIPGGNPQLNPEEGFMVDFSVSSAGEGVFQQKLKFFYSDIDNWIQWQPSANGAWYWEAANVKNVLSRGVEYDLSTRFNLHKIGFLIGGNYAFTRSTNENAVSSADKSRGKQLIYIPIHTGNINGLATWKSWSLKCHLGYTGRRYTQSSSEWSHYESVLNPFWLTTASLGKDFYSGKWQINANLKAENLFNINYQQILWRPMPGRHYSFTLALNRKK